VWEKFVVDLQEDYKGSKLLHAVTRNKMKPKTELCSMLDKHRKLIWTPYDMDGTRHGVIK
jgi:hypothetical protein